MGRGMKVCLRGPGRMSNMAVRPILALKPFNFFLLRNELASEHRTWYAALETRAHHSLFT